METTHAALKAFATFLSDTQTRLLTHITAGELNTEEAAKSFSGALLKYFIEEEGRPSASIDRASLYRQCLHDLESRLPGYTGIVLGRHI